MSIKGHLLATGALWHIRRLNEVRPTPKSMATANITTRPLKGREDCSLVSKRLWHQLERRNFAHNYPYWRYGWIGRLLRL
ncbi:hypothetical protein B7R77_25575 [Ralstonia solanacearum K60]|uniref:Uncharacterized protein n=1 Tax=Ralstonia solanacearum K60 TaxID=1091042 RepID=A0AAP8D2H1_RALSL|nr:hypothetical protein B7R77_25575 [Ralstonia solanacearum K60]